MDIRLFSFTSLLIGLFCTSSLASNHNRNSRNNVKISQDSIPFDCLPRNNEFNSSSNPTFLTIKPKNNFWMTVDLLVYDDSNGEQSSNEGRYSKDFVLKGTGVERYQSFQVNITALEDMWNTNWWKIDVSTESKNIDIKTTGTPDTGWIYGHAFHFMTIHLAPGSGEWYDTKCWEKIRYATTDSSSTLSTTKSKKTVSVSTEFIPNKPVIKESTATESSTKQSGRTSTATESSTKQSGRTSTATESSTKQSGRTSTATESSTKQSGSTSTPMQEVEGRVQENKMFIFVKFFFFEK